MVGFREQDEEAHICIIRRPEDCRVGGLMKGPQGLWALNWGLS